MKSEYPLSKSMRLALESVYGDLGRPRMILGVGQAPWTEELREEPQRRRDPPIVRAARLRQYLEETVQDLAAQEHELGSASYTVQVRNEIVGLLIALRELYRHLPEAFDAAAPVDLILRRIAGFHRETGLSRILGPVEPIQPPADPAEVRALEDELGEPLPEEYRAFLERCRYLFISAGYQVWGLGSENPELRPRIEEYAGQRWFVCGDYWEWEDGDVVAVDLEVEPGSVSILRYHEERSEPFAPSFSAAVERLADAVCPEEGWEQVVAETRTKVDLALRPWWKKMLGVR